MSINPYWIFQNYDMPVYTPKDIKRKFGRKLYYISQKLYIIKEHKKTV